MLIYDDIFVWEGWGGKLRLGSGKCRLRIYDRGKGREEALTHLRPIIVIVSDVADSAMSVRSCVSHIATCITRDFKINPNRMLFVEYYPASSYGEKQQHVIPEKCDAVEFIWHGRKALRPVWRTLNPEMLAELKRFMQKHTGNPLT